jgi:hypothetical protein
MQHQSVPGHGQSLRWFGAQHDDDHTLFMQASYDVTDPDARSLVDYLSVQLRGFEELSFLSDFDLIHFVFLRPTVLAGIRGEAQPAHSTHSTKIHRHVQRNLVALDEQRNVPGGVFD